MNKRALFSVALLWVALLALSGCAQKEKAIILPPAGSALPGSVAMGPTYTDQVFYNLETNSIAGTSVINSWDLAFEAAADGSHVYMNGGKGVFLYNTHQTDFAAITALPAGVTNASWLFDDPGGRPDSTAVREWRDASGQSRQEVFIAKVDDTTFYKLVLLTVDATGYTFRYGRLAATTPLEVSLTKDAAYNYSYFSFAGGAVNPDPPKAEWDVVFTRYRYIYRYLDNLPYEVNGVLLNPYKVSGAADSSSTFSALTLENTASLPLTTQRDMIGSDWKTYNFATTRYEVNKNKCYLLHTRNDQVYKLHFLDFYSSSGVKGTPSFESQQLQ